MKQRNETKEWEQCSFVQQPVSSHGLSFTWHRYGLPSLFSRRYHNYPSLAGRCPLLLKKFSLTDLEWKKSHPGSWFLFTTQKPHLGTDKPKPPASYLLTHTVMLSTSRRPRQQHVKTQQKKVLWWRTGSQSSAHRLVFTNETRISFIFVMTRT